jgi:hypothetical protein
VKETAAQRARTNGQQEKTADAATPSIREGKTMERISRTAAVVALAVAGASAVPADAGVAVASFGVSARVVGEARIEGVAAPDHVVLLAEDLARGYKEIDARYRVQAARIDRYLLNLAPRIGLASLIHVEGLGAPVTLGESDITVLQAAPAGTSELRLRLRLKLRPGLAPGAYPFPLHLSVSAPSATQ